MLPATSEHEIDEINGENDTLTSNQTSPIVEGGGLLRQTIVLFFIITSGNFSSSIYVKKVKAWKF